MSAPVINPSVTISKGAYYGQTPYTPFVSPASNTFTFGGVLEGFGKRAAREEYAKAELVRTQSDPGLDAVLALVGAAVRG